MYHLYEGKSFAILSFFLDSSKEDVAKFQAGKREMPWLNTWIDHGFENRICKDFEVYSNPKLVLVGPEGKVICSGWDLRGNKLELALERYLGKKD